MKMFQRVAILCLLHLFLSNCKKNLDQPALGLIDESKVTNLKGVEGLLIGAYSLLDGAGLGTVPGPDFETWHSSASNWIYGSISGSEAYKGSELISDDQREILQIETWQSTPQNPYMDRKWSAVYGGVQRANTVLRVMKKATGISAQDQQRITAEARFLRGFFHFEAIKMWNKVPYVDETVTYENENYFLPNDTLIWGAIENDFRFAMMNLPGIMPAVGRANKYAAEAFLAKALMFQGRIDQNKYILAKSLLEDLINNGITAGGLTYALLPMYADNFNPATKNSSESVFAVQNSVNDRAYGTNGNIGDVLNFPNNFSAPGQCCGFFQPSQYLVNHFKTDPANGLPDLDHFNETDVKNDQGLNSSDPFIPYTGSLDPRIDFTIGRRGIPYLDWGNHPGKDWIRDINMGFGPYSPIKNSYKKSQQGHLSDANFWTTGSTALNVNLIRFADVLLWLAEAEAESGNLGKSMEYVNRVRSRAADPSVWVQSNSGAFAPYAANYKVGSYQSADWISKEFALKAIRFERMLEMGMEGHRFFDLVRWGIAYQEINKYLEKEKTIRTYLAGAQFKKGVHEYFPIPQKQFDLSAGADGIPKLKQNPGY